jgi:hypothetical protein
MPAKTHKTDYLILGTLVTVTAVILLGFIWAGWLQEDALQERFIRSAHSAREDGVKAFYTLLAGQGIAVSTNEQRFQRESLAQVGVLVSLDPVVSINAAEVMELRRCLERGLILITTHIPHGLVEELKDLPSSSPGRSRKTIKRRNKPDEFKRTPVPQGDRGLPLAQDIHTVCIRSKTVITPKGDQESLTSVPLFRDSIGLRVVEYPIGAGRLILLSDSSFLANERLAHDDNAVLAVNLIAHVLQSESARSLMFDEYHFAYGGSHQGMGILGALLLTTPAGWAVLCLALAGILLLIYQGRQFGPRHDLVTETRRSKLDYIQAVGATYCAAQAHGLCLRHIYHAFRQKLATHAGLPVTAANKVLITELSRHTPMDGVTSESALNNCDALLSGTQVSAGQLHRALQQLSKIEMEVFHE